MIAFPTTIWGGANQREQLGALVRRSHASNGQAWQQIAPAESPDSWNMDFWPQGIRARLGSELDESIASILASGDTILNACLWINPTTGVEIEMALGAKSIYAELSGVWTRLTDATATAFSWPSTATKVGFEQIEGHMIIGADGSGNPMQVYRSGTALDDVMHNSTTTTTVNVTSNSGQKVLSVAATAQCRVGDRVIINEGGAREEYGYIVSMVAATSITLFANLTYQHTSAQADVVETRNRFTDAYGTNATHNYTGDWKTGVFLLAEIQGRLAMSTGDVEVEFSPPSREDSSGIWNLLSTTEGAVFSDGYVEMLSQFIPYGGQETDGILYIGSGLGMMATTGAQEYDTTRKGLTTEAPMNHKCWCKSKGWLIYLTKNKNLLAVNGTTVIDLGARLKADDGTGVLDSIDVTETATYGFMVYGKDKRAAILFATTASGRVNDIAVLIDFKRGEPQVGEVLEQFEPRVRLLPWKLLNPDANDWFVCGYQTQSNLKAFLPSGALYNLDSGTNDLGTLAIEHNYKRAPFDGGDTVSAHLKQGYRYDSTYIATGDWDITNNVYLDYSTAESKEYNVTQVTDDSFILDESLLDVDILGPGILVKHYEPLARGDIPRWEVFQHEYAEADTSETFILVSDTLFYDVGTLVR